MTPTLYPALRREIPTMWGADATYYTTFSPTRLTSVFSLLNMRGQHIAYLHRDGGFTFNGINYRPS